MKLISILILSLGFSISFQSISQTIIQPGGHKEISVKNDIALKRLNIQFETEQEINNLLVVISDKNGETVFLDNQYRFKGKYDRIVDIKDYGKGEFTLKVVRDENIFYQQITVP